MADQHGSQDSQPDSERDPDQPADLPAPKLPDNSGPHARSTEGANKPEHTGDDIKPFEQRMFWLTAIGISLAAITGIIFYGQFKEMISQTDMLSISARQARRDSAGADIRAQQQIAILQKQATAAQDSVKAVQRQMRIDQRSWMRFELGGEAIEGKPDKRKVFITKGEAPSATVKFTNVGKGAARGLRAIHLSSALTQTKNPILRESRNWERNPMPSRRAASNSPAIVRKQMLFVRGGKM